MKRYFGVILLCALAVTLAFEIIQLVQLRFEAGDVYPAYSSLRSDPLGTMALFESLQAIPGLNVQRDLRPTNTMPQLKSLTYLHLATSAEGWMAMPEETFREIETFLKSGGRLVVTFFPLAKRPPEPIRPRQEPAESKDNSKDKKKPSARELWGMNFEVMDLKADGDTFIPEVVQHEGGLSLPPDLTWHSGIVLSGLDPAWKPIYSRGGAPVLIERAFGEGTVVIATDSYFLSNEAMLKDRQSSLLSWLIGPNREIMFDEAHLGITESPGVATLIQRYRLTGLVAGLLIVAGLYVWKNSTSLVPKPTEVVMEAHVEGRDSAAGFVNLLRRSVPADQVLAACFAEWRKSAAQGAISPARIAAAESAYEAERSNPKKDKDSVRAYNTISNILRRKTR
jgi:hypothetical protein